MFHAVDLDEVRMMRTVGPSMFKDRALQFVTRHEWPLKLRPDGLEVDQFDDDRTTYCIVEERGRHLASVRLRPARAGSMVESCFPELWRDSASRLRDGHEVTRFCTTPGLSAERRLEVVSDLLLGLCRHCRATGVDSFFGIVFPAVARSLRQTGWPARVLDQSRDPSGTLLLAQWAATELVAWDIQERREFREALMRDRKLPVTEVEQLVA